MPPVPSRSVRSTPKQLFDKLRSRFFNHAFTLVGEKIAAKMEKGKLTGQLEDDVLVLVAKLQFLEGIDASIIDCNSGRL